MASSSLSLSVVKGPKKGETLDCSPGDLIRIGRVIRGNTFAIKDPSISQKHLTIRFLPELTLWAVTDLGSSNGTFVNDAPISPDDPAPLADGDVIRIGDTTTISVHISAPQAEPFPHRRPSKAKMLEEEKVSKPEEIGRKGRARGRIMNKKVLQPVVMEHTSGRVTRASSRASSRAETAIVSAPKPEEENIAIVISDSESGEGLTNEVPLRQNNVCAEEEDPTESREKKARDVKVEDEMDNMTLGEWFNRMEEYLPKEINRIAEEIIAKLRDKARRFDEYVAPPSNSIDG